MTERLLAVMGSGETTPTMAKLHRELFERLGPGPIKAVVLDTPYGFQLNASDISARAVGYFKESVGRSVEVASLPRTEGAPPLALEEALARVAEALWLFSGPGSPTYALRQWRPTVVPQLLAEKLSLGGCIVFSSAAALTLGRWTVPVYEIYKAGADLYWAEGLDLLGPHGLNVAVVPHYNNAEGGTHDTRYCYLGEPRLAALEQRLPEDAWVLGVDEHTACVFDLEAETASVSGLGALTVRRRGRSAVVPAGTTLGIKQLVDLALAAEGPSFAGSGTKSPLAGPSSPVPPSASSPATLPGPSNPTAPSSGSGQVAAPSPFLVEVAGLAERFDQAMSSRDAGAATEAVLRLEEAVHEWSADTFQSDELDRARAELRRMVVRLGEAAKSGLVDPREVATPWVEALLAERAEARHSRRYADADRIRDNLAAAGVEVRDTPAGTEWDLRPDKGAAGPSAAGAPA